MRGIGKRIGAIATDHDIIAQAAIEHVVARLAIKTIIAGAAIKGVIAQAATEDIIAITAADFSGDIQNAIAEEIIAPAAGNDDAGDSGLGESHVGAIE